MIDLFVLDDFFDAAEREAVLTELRTSPGAPASVYGARSNVEERVRKTTRIAAAPHLEQLILAKLIERKGEVEGHFDVQLSDCEEPQFLRYQTGDFFVAHQDGNTPTVRQAQKRTISVVVFVSDPADYEGGTLLFHGDYRDPRFRLTAPAAAGSLVAFRAESTHEVTPVTSGERYTIVSWYR